MKTINALGIRKELGAVLESLRKGGEPVIVTKDREPVAALIPISLFRQRFVDYLSKEAVQKKMDELAALRVSAAGEDSLEILRTLREGRQARERR